MPNTTRSRREILAVIAGLLAYCSITAVSGAATQGPTGEPAASNSPRTESAGSSDNRQLSGVYRATVDRVVDDSYVVLLLERDGRVIDQVVLSAGEYPDLSARDNVVVSLIWGRVLAVW